ncbi:MAG: 4Fe-4S ferredoxin, partial [Planctomycetes bacterium RIFCSPHIGHO2_02_FULL_40_12]
MSDCCPGSRTMDFSEKDEQAEETGARQSQLKQWPIQLHLVSPQAPYFQERDILLVADCVPFALADFHKDYLKGKSLAIACPKLDSEQEIYVEKITALIDESKINTLTVMIMKVPCCMGLTHLAKSGAEKATRKIPIKQVVVDVAGGQILS